MQITFSNALEERVRVGIPGRACLLVWVMSEHLATVWKIQMSVLSTRECVSIRTSALDLIRRCLVTECGQTKNFVVILILPLLGI